VNDKQPPLAAVVLCPFSICLLDLMINPAAIVSVEPTLFSKTHTGRSNLKKEVL